MLTSTKKPISTTAMPTGMACVAGDGASSTSGTRCGGLYGWAARQRSGCAAAVWMSLIERPDELVQMRASAGAAERGELLAALGVDRFAHVRGATTCVWNQAESGIDSPSSE